MTTKFRIVNETGGEMLSGDFEHQTGRSGPTTGAITFPKLADGEASNYVEVPVDGAKLDYWCFSFKSNGQLKVGDKECDLLPKDKDTEIDWIFTSDGKYKLKLQSGGCSGSWI